MALSLNLVKHVGSGQYDNIVTEDIISACTFLRQHDNSNDDKSRVLTCIELLTQKLLKSTKNQTIINLKNELNNLNKERSDLSARVDSVMQQLNKAQDNIQKLEISALEARITTLQLEQAGTAALTTTVGTTIGVGAAVLTGVVLTTPLIIATPFLAAGLGWLFQYSHNNPMIIEISYWHQVKDRMQVQGLHLKEAVAVVPVPRNIDLSSTRKLLRLNGATV